MNNSYLTEAFTELSSLNEEVYDLTDDGIEKLADDMEDIEVEDTIDIIDPEAESEEEIQDSYIGKVICDCSVCHSKLYKDKADIVVDEESGLANVEEECPYCFTTEGFKIIGEVGQFKPETDVETDDTDVEIDTTEEEKKDDDLDEALNEKIYHKGMSSSKVNAAKERSSSEQSQIDKSKFDARRVDKPGLVDKVFNTKYNRQYNSIKKAQKINQNADNSYSRRADDAYDREQSDIVKRNDPKNWDKDLNDARDKYNKGKADNRKEARKQYGESVESLKEARVPTSSYMINVDGKPYEFICKTVSARNGFAHVVDILADGNEVGHARATYMNRTWESYQYQSAMRKAVNKSSLSDDVKNALLTKIEAGTSSFKESVELKESPTYDLKPEYDSRKSFYNKAQVDVNEENGVKTLMSYNTPVCRIANGKVELLPAWDYSATTLRHIKDFLQQNGFEAYPKSQMTKHYDVVNESLDESLENISIETDTDVINVTSQPKEEEVEETVNEEEAIVPVSDETIDDIEEENADDEEEVAMDEFDEENFDNLGEQYLKENYSNVVSYKTNKVTSANGKLCVEGVIKFNSGKSKSTQFIFEAKDKLQNGKYRLIGENKQISRGKKAFTVTGNFNESKFIAESMTYNYRAKDSETNTSKRVYGTVKNSK